MSMTNTFDKFWIADTSPVTTAIETTPLQRMIECGEIFPLMIVESGSRAWEFDSDDSDYDIRFVYTRPTAWYLALDQRSDHLQFSSEFNGKELDIVGWDLRKFLGLVKKGNAQVYEWVFGSPRYFMSLDFLKVAEGVMDYCFDQAKLAMHYRGLFHKTYYGYLFDRDMIILKKYLYALRALWCLEWYMGGDTPNPRIAPTRFLSLMVQASVPGHARSGIVSLLEMKRRGIELGKSAPDPYIDAYIKDRVSAWDNVDLKPLRNPDWEIVNGAFQEIQDRCTTSARRVR